MKLVRYGTGHGPAVGLIDEQDQVWPTGFTKMSEVIAAGGALEPVKGSQPIVGARLLPPIERPGKILCAGVNYLSHKDENPSAVLPAVPFFFSKLPSAVVGPGDPIVLPEPTSEVDYEVELAVVIGRRAKRLSEEDALSCVFGYTVANDVSARDVQFVDNQITLGKGFDTFCPIGPAIVAVHDLPDPQDLTVASYVNGERRQYERTAGMLFPVAQLLSFLSRHITLEPGDVVTTGTPAGVGTFRSPPEYLRPGDVVDVEVDVIGRLSNPVAAGW
jgi:2,4-diketo-3-deoxy-L-fuconate hydrolase